MASHLARVISCFLLTLHFLLSMAYQLKLAAVPAMSFALKEFGGGSANELEKLLMGTSVREGDAADFVEVLPHVSCLLVGGFQFSEMQTEAKQQMFTTNARATVKAFNGLALTGPAITTRASSASRARLQAFGQRVLAGMEIPLVASSKDKAALRFLAEVSVMSTGEVARALRGRQGQEFVQTLSDSPTFAAVVIYAAWWDDVWDWIQGAASWVADAVNTFGDEAAKVANAVVEGVFSKHEGATKFLEQIPGVGLVVAGIYYTAGKTDMGTAALAYNLNAIVTCVGAGVGLFVGGPAGAMAGGALGKALGLLLQKALSLLIEDKKIKAEVGDISATRVIIDIALAGAASAGAGAVGSALAEGLGLSAVKAFATSQALSALLAGLPGYLAKAAAAS